MKVSNERWPQHTAQSKSEDSVHLDSFTSGPLRPTHDGEHLHWSHAVSKNLIYDSFLLKKITLRHKMAEMYYFNSSLNLSEGLKWREEKTKTQKTQKGTRLKTEFCMQTVQFHFHLSVMLIAVITCCLRFCVDDQMVDLCQSNISSISGDTTVIVLH